MPSAPNNSYTQVTYFGVALPNSRQLPSVRAQTQIIVQKRTYCFFLKIYLFVAALGPSCGMWAVLLPGMQDP